MKAVPNKPMVPTAPTSPTEYARSSRRQYIGEPLGRERWAASGGLVVVGNLVVGLW